MLAEAGKIAGPRRTRIDGRGHRTLAAEILRIDAKRGAAPIDMRVHVDEAGGDDKARNIARLDACRNRNGFRNGRHLARVKGHIHFRVNALPRIDNMPALQHQIIRRHAASINSSS